MLRQPHHDKAYHWAERRKLETHPKTGAAQLVELRETVQEIIIPKYVEVEQPAPPKPLLFAQLPDDELLGYGVPAEWLSDVRQVNEDTLLHLADHLPSEAAEALLELATGGRPQVPQPVLKGTDPFAHPDAQRRFRVMKNVEELEQALDYPWEKWTIFLHPSQRQLVERVPHRRGDEPCTIMNHLIVVWCSPTGVGMNRTNIVRDSRAFCVPHRRGDEPAIEVQGFGLDYSKDHSRVLP